LGSAWYSSDRGFFSDENIKRARRSSSSAFRSGVEKEPLNGKRLKGALSSRRDNAFGAGIEGRISVLFVGRGMKRCLAEGRDRFEVLIGAAVLTNNLMNIAHLLNQKQKRLRRAA